MYYFVIGLIFINKTEILEVAVFLYSLTNDALNWVM